MKPFKSLAAAIALAVPASAMAQAYPAERITVHEHPPHEFTQLKSGLASGGDNPEDTRLADSVAIAFSRDRSLDDVTATVSANRGQVSFTGLGSYSESQRAQQVAQRVAGVRNASGHLSSDLG